MMTTTMMTTVTYQEKGQVFPALPGPSWPRPIVPVNSPRVTFTMKCSCIRV